MTPSTKTYAFLSLAGLFFFILSSYAQAAANDNIVNYWAHNQTTGTTVLDIYNRTNLTMTSAVWNNNVIDFSGNSAARIVTSASYAGGDIRAICLAMYPSNPWTSGTGYLMKVTGGTEVYVNSAAHITLTDGTGTLATTQSNTVTSQSSDIYTHVCLNFNGNQTEIWVNGTNQTLSTANYPYYNLSGAGNALWTIGNYNNNALGFHGSLKEIATFNKLLTSAQIASIYNNGNFANLGNDSTPPTVSNITVNVIAKNITSGATISSFTVYYVNSTGGTVIGVNTSSGLATFNVSPEHIYNFTVTNATGFNSTFLALNITNTSSNYSGGNYSLNVSLTYNTSSGGNSTPTPSGFGTGIVMELNSDWQYTNISGRFWADIYFNGTYLNVSSVNITIVNQSLGVIVNNLAMTKFQTGQYYYNITPNISGQYHAYALASNGTDTMATDAVSITVVDNIPTKTMEAFDMILSTFLLFSIGMLFIVVGYYARIDEFWLAASIWFIANTVQLIINTGLAALSSASSLFFALLGLAIFYYYIDLKVKYWFGKKRERDNTEYE